MALYTHSNDDEENTDDILLGDPGGEVGARVLLDRGGFPMRSCIDLILSVFFPCFCKVTYSIDDDDDDEPEPKRSIGDLDLLLDGGPVNDPPFVVSRV